jgi:similar to stage IV sporulation protein
VRRTAIKIGHLSIPIWGFKKVQYQNKQQEQDETAIKFLKWTLPIAIEKTTIREVEIHEKAYNEEEAKQLALSIAKKNVIESIPKDAKIVEEKVLHEKVENGKLKLLVTYDVIENIAKEEPIIPQEEPIIQN